MVSTQVGAALGAFLGAWVAAFGEDRAAGGFASCRGYAVICGIRRRLVDSGGGWRFSLRRGRGGGRPAGFLLGACGGRRLGGVGMWRLEAGVARCGAPCLVSRSVGGRVALCGRRVARRVCRGGWRLEGAEALGAGRVRRRCRLRDVWFGPRFLVCAAAT